MVTADDVLKIWSVQGTPWGRFRVGKRDSLKATKLIFSLGDIAVHWRFVMTFCYDSAGVEVKKQ